MFLFLDAVFDLNDFEISRTLIKMFITKVPGVGVFGCNRKSEYLVNCLIKNGFKVTSIWSDCLEEAREFAKRFQIESYTDKIDVILLKKEVELILINCQQIHYVQIVSKAFRIGKF